jgi:hypothetical protein
MGDVVGSKLSAGSTDFAMLTNIKMPMQITNTAAMINSRSDIICMFSIKRIDNKLAQISIRRVASLSKVVGG